MKHMLILTPDSEDALSTSSSSSTSSSPSSSCESFVREYDLENETGTIFLSQKLLGDVSCVVWDAALVLAKYLEKRCLEDEKFLSGKRVIELGSGLGCVGIVAACYGADVILTDLPSAIPQLKENVKNNQQLVQTGKGSAEVLPLDWSQDTLLEACDILLVGDCVYYKESIPGLVQTMVHLSTAATHVFLSQENRYYSDIQTAVWNEFCEEIKKYFQFQIIPRKEQHHQFQSGDIFLIHLTRLEIN